MKRDLDLVRGLLLEKWLKLPEDNSLRPMWVAKGYTREQLVYHHWLIEDAGFTDNDRLTFKGQFVAALLSGDDLWNDAKAAVEKSSLESVPLKIMIDWMCKEAARRVELAEWCTK